MTATAKPTWNLVKPILFQFAKGDMTVPNPTSTALLRAGDLAERATYFRNDLAWFADPAVPKDPHQFLTRTSAIATQRFALGAQTQIATFFQSNGTTAVIPDDVKQFFEVPIVLPLPESLNFIP